MSPQIPEGMREDAAATWPPRELIDSFLGGHDFEFRLGEHTPIPDTEEAAAQARNFRDVLGQFCTGVTVVTSMSDGEPVGMTCQSFTSVSLDPPLVMFCPAKTSRAFPLMRRAGYFCVNLLAADQVDISNGMATKGANKYDGVSYQPAVTGAPVLDGVLGYIDCSIEAVHEGGDHYLVVGRVRELAVGDKSGNQPDEPLLFYRGKYTRTE